MSDEITINGESYKIYGEVVNSIAIVYPWRSMLPYYGYSLTGLANIDTKEIVVPIDSADVARFKGHFFIMPWKDNTFSLYSTYDKKLVLENYEFLMYEEDQDNYSVMRIIPPSLNIFKGLWVARCKDGYRILDFDSNTSPSLDRPYDLYSELFDDVHLLKEIGKTKYFVTCKGNLKGIYSHSVHFTPNYDEIELENDIIIFTKNGKMSYMRISSNDIVSNEYDEIKSHDNNLVEGINDNTHTFYHPIFSEEGLSYEDLILKITCEDITYYKYDENTYFFIFKENGKYGIIESKKTTKEIVDTEESNVHQQFVSHFYSKLVIPYFINTTLEMPIYDEIEYHDGTFILKKDNLYGILYLNKSGEDLIVNPIYSKYEMVSDDVILLYHGGICDVFKKHEGIIRRNMELSSIEKMDNVYLTGVAFKNLYFLEVIGQNECYTIPTTDKHLELRDDRYAYFMESCFLGKEILDENLILVDYGNLKRSYQALKNVYYKDRLLFSSDGEEISFHKYIVDGKDYSYVACKSFGEWKIKSNQDEYREEFDLGDEILKELIFFKNAIFMRFLTHACIYEPTLTHVKIYNKDVKISKIVYGSNEEVLDIDDSCLSDGDENYYIRYKDYFKEVRENMSLKREKPKVDKGGKHEN